MTRLNIRPYKKGDETAIVPFLRSVFPNWGGADVNQAMDVWEWKYQKSSEQISPLAWVAEDRGELIGHHGLVPVRMKIGQHYVTGADSVDGAVFSEYRYQGVFTSLSRKLYAEAADRGISILYGFPNSLAKPPQYELGFSDVCAFKSMVKILNFKVLLHAIASKPLKMNPAWWAGISRTIFSRESGGKRREDMGIRIHKIASFDDSFDSLWSEISGMADILIVRDKTYMNWRYVACPWVYEIFSVEKGRKPLGCLILSLQVDKRGIRYARIMDLLLTAGHEDIADLLFQEAFRSLKNRGVAYLFFPISTCHPFYCQITGCGFSCLGEFDAGFIAKTLQGINPMIAQSFIQDPGNWLVSVGDSDWL